MAVAPVVAPVTAAILIIEGNMVGWCVLNKGGCSKSLLEVVCDVLGLGVRKRGCSTSVDGV